MIRTVVVAVFVVAIVMIAAPSMAVGQQADGAMSKDKLVKILKQNNTSQQELAAIVAQTGVDFQMSADDEKKLRQAGASDDLIAAARNNYQGQPQPDNKKPEETENKTQPEEPLKIPTPKETQLPKPQTPARPESEKIEQTANPIVQQRPQKQDKDIKFKVGDQVEVDISMRGDYAGADKYAQWRPGKITGIENPNDRLGYYVVQVDEDGRELHIRFRTRDVRWIRAPQGPQ